MTRRLLLEHYKKYPALEAQDIFKFIFQSACGCEHLVTDKSRAIEYIRYEYQNAPVGEPKIDALDGNYSRAYLSCINGGFTVEDLGEIFVRSARREPDCKAKIEEKLSVARKLIENGEIKLDLREFDMQAEKWRSLGFPAIHHSDAFRNAYHPAYRVIHNDFLGEIDYGN